MSASNIIDDFGEFGRRYLIPESRTHKALAEYGWQLSTICSLIRRTHSIVVARLEAIEAAESLDAAQGIVSELDGKPLTDAFRVRGLCDVFEGFGKSLLRLVEPHGSASDPPVAQSLPDLQRGRLRELFEILAAREREVAVLYAEQIDEISDLVRGRPHSDLAEVKKLAADARAVLTHQMHDLDALSRDFDAISVQ